MVSGLRRRSVALLDRSRDCRLAAPRRQRSDDRARPGAGEGRGDVGTELEPPVRPFVVGAGQVGGDRLADEVVELGAREERARAADQRVGGRRDRVVERGVLGAAPRR